MWLIGYLLLGYLTQLYFYFRYWRSEEPEADWMYKYLVPIMFILTWPIVIILEIIISIDERKRGL